MYPPAQAFDLGPHGRQTHAAAGKVPELPPGGKTIPEQQRQNGFLVHDGQFLGSGQAGFEGPGPYRRHIDTTAVIRHFDAQYPFPVRHPAGEMSRFGFTGLVPFLGRFQTVVHGIAKSMTTPLRVMILSSRKGSALPTKKSNKAITPGPDAQHGPD